MILLSKQNLLQQTEPKLTCGTEMQVLEGLADVEASHAITSFAENERELLPQPPLVQPAGQLPPLPPLLLPPPPRASDQCFNNLESACPHSETSRPHSENVRSHSGSIRPHSVNIRPHLVNAPNKDETNTTNVWHFLEHACVVSATLPEAEASFRIVNGVTSTDAAATVGSAFSYFDLRARARQLAGFLLRNGTKPGDRIGIVLRNSIAGTRTKIQ
jgi:hypothetical protein